MGAKVLNMRVEWFARHYKGAKFHALLCDPPYHLTSITERFGAGNAAPAQYGTNGAFSRASRGFMGKQWDGGDIAFRPDTWAALAEHLYPGAFGMAFASSRGWHRMAVAIEDSGMVIHPTIFNWAFGSGFPKATRIDTQVDKAAGAERPKVWADRYHDGRTREIETGDNDSMFGKVGNNGNFIELPATDLAKAWSGHRYGAQAMKPAIEPIIVFQKPYVGRSVDCITGTGAGALNIEAARIPLNPDDPNIRNNPSVDRNMGGVTYDVRGSRDQRYPTLQDGRWPANFVMDSEAARRLDLQSGESVSSSHTRNNEENKSVAKGRDLPHETKGFDDSGGASRFFHNYDWQLEVEEQLAAADPVLYMAKASSEERDAGLSHRKAQTVGDGRIKSIDNAYQRGETERLNVHPTIKPIGLTEWLAKLLLPPKEYGPRRLLIPFSGAGSEMIGAYRAGWEDVTGIEMTREYVEIARARLEYWRMQGVQLSLFDAA